MDKKYCKEFCDMIKNKEYITNIIKKFLLNINFGILVKENKKDIKRDKNLNNKFLTPFLIFIKSYYKNLNFYIFTYYMLFEIPLMK
ncbi:hypothetical protein YN1_8300 [Nanoarchaeota archaeon]